MGGLFSLLHRAIKQHTFFAGQSSDKGGCLMEQFLLDMAAQVAAGVIVALFVYWLNRR